MPKKEVSKNDKKEKKENKHFFKDFKAELKRVIWPTPKQLFNNTVAVITIVLITAIIVFVLDFAFEKMNEYGIEKLKKVVETTNTVVENEVSNETDTNSSADQNTQANQAVENAESN